MSQGSRRFTLVFVLCLAVLILAWLCIARWVVPSLIDASYHGRSLGVLNDIITGQSTRSLDQYLEHWRRVANTVTLALGIAGVLLYPILRARHLLVAKALESHRWLTRIPLRGTEFLRMTAWLGGMAGLLEGIFVYARWTVANPPSRAYSPYVLWMAPITMATLFLLGGLAVLLAVRWRGAVHQGYAVLLFVFAASYTLLRLPKLGLHNYSVLILALGMAISATRLTNSRSVQFRRLVRFSTGWLAGGVFLLAAGMSLYKEVAEWRALRRLPAHASGAPNILLLILDTVRASNMSLYGYARPTTPFLEELASTGVTFEMAIAPSAWTLPSHASILTGRHPHELSADWMIPLNGAFPTLAEVLAERGYATAGFVANYYYAARETGLARGFVRYDDYPISLGMLVRNSWLARRLAAPIRRLFRNHQDLARRSAEDVNTSFLHWLARSQNRPFFAFLNYFDSHDPYLPPKTWESRLSQSEDLYWLSRPEGYSPQELQELTNSYDNTLDYLDAQIGALLNNLRAQGLLANTLIILTSDHGEQFGERDSRLMGHGNSLYLPLLRTPLIMVYGSHIPMNRRIQTPVSLRDIPATVMEFANVETASPFPGASLSRYWSDTVSHQSQILSSVNPNKWTAPWEPISQGPLKSLVLDNLHYIQTGDDQEELYNVVTDPWERVDISQTEAGRRELPHVRECLEDMLNTMAVPADGGMLSDPPLSCVRSAIRTSSSSESLHAATR